MLVSSGTAPVVLIGGWTVAASRQPPNYDSMTDTISALAARGATDRWIMTLALLILGMCHVVTASGLTGAGTAARAVLAVGGTATIGVAALPQPDALHVPVATGAFVALAVWPALSRAPARRVGLGAAAVLLALLAWLAWLLAEADHGALLGLGERCVAGAQALCPLVISLVYLASSGVGDK